ncbi:MAG: hypothetical protein S4CHLAM81_07290 [Chlamydiales bacterium]|nr:hypothetical protein [Chlamydiales bacterium]MCH9635513.1 hypothetical protein [Chlamydiales bacterium]MCH9703367.1 tetratricopeptide repeat protein [Chlamydiota bacterium]
MASNKWTELLGWGSERIEEIRFFGFSILREGKYEDAKLFFEVLLILDDSPFDRQTLGAIHLQMNENEQAIEQLDLALEKEPGHEPTLLNKAKALFASDRPSEALAIVQKLTKSDNEILASDAEALIMVHS